MLGQNGEGNVSESGLREEIQRRKAKVDLAYSKGLNPWGQKYVSTHFAEEIADKCDSMLGEEVSIAGRLMAFRGHGKASFADLWDRTGRVQIHARLDILGEKGYGDFGEILDLGDIIGVRGVVFRTKSGQPTVEVHEWTMLSKALRPLPEKWHGLTDVDLRYRQRYVDLIVNPEVKEIFVKRSKIISYIRKYLDGRGFLEVQTPVLQPIAGGANARPFLTHHNALDIGMAMRIATELYLKRLIVGGMDRVYEIGPDFRNEGIDTKHNPEFYMLEVYQAYADYHDMMDLVEEMVSGCALEVLGTTKISAGGQETDLTPPWKRLTVWEAITRETGILPGQLSDDEDARAIVERLNLKMEKGISKGSVIDKLLDVFVEPKLLEPTFLMDYPVEISPLAKRMETDPSLTYRFEPFVLARELGNAFSELNDPIDQKERFASQVREKALGDDEAHPYDEDFITALEYGMPPTGGLGIGIERLVMLLCGIESIRDVMLFPMLRPKT